MKPEVCQLHGRSAQWRTQWALQAAEQRLEPGRAEFLPARGMKGAGCASSCDGGTCAARGTEWGECRPDEEPGKSILWGESFGFGKRYTSGEEGEGSCDMGNMGAGEMMEQEREQCTRTVPSDGFKAFSGWPCRLICHKGLKLYFPRRALVSKTPSPCPVTTG